MVRTKADAYTKAAVKAPRKTASMGGGSSTPKSSGKADKYTGGNSYCPRPVPEWQKPITSFFSKGGCATETSKSSLEEMEIEKNSIEGGTSSDIICESESTPSCSKDDPSASELGASKICESESTASESVPHANTPDIEPVPGCSLSSNDENDNSTKDNE